METLPSTTASIPHRPDILLAPDPVEAIPSTSPEFCADIGHTAAITTISPTTEQGTPGGKRPQTLGDVLSAEMPTITLEPLTFTTKKPIAKNEANIQVAASPTENAAPKSVTEPAATPSGRHRNERPDSKLTEYRNRRRYSGRHESRALQPKHKAILTAAGAVAMTAALLVPGTKTEAPTVPLTIGQEAPSTEITRKKILTDAGTLPPAVKAPVESHASKIARIKAKIAEYTWPSYRPAGTKGAKTMRPAYMRDLAKEKNRYEGGANGVDCGAFTTLVMRETVDPNYNSANGNTGEQMRYLEQHDDVRPKAGEQVLYHKVRAKEALQPGDIAVQNNVMRGGHIHHTFFYVGKHMKGLDAKGKPTSFNGPVASASLGSRAPMASKWYGSFRTTFEWFRLI